MADSGTVLIAIAGILGTLGAPLISAHVQRKARLADFRLQRQVAKREDLKAAYLTIQAYCTKIQIAAHDLELGQTQQEDTDMGAEDTRDAVFDAMGKVLLEAEDPELTHMHAKVVSAYNTYLACHHTATSSARFIPNIDPVEALAKLNQEISAITNHMRETLRKLDDATPARGRTH